MRKRNRGIFFVSLVIAGGFAFACLTWLVAPSRARVQASNAAPADYQKF
jgi:hypothetical protein